MFFTISSSLDDELGIGPVYVQGHCFFFSSFRELLSCDHIFDNSNNKDCELGIAPAIGDFMLCVTAMFLVKL